MTAGSSASCSREGALLSRRSMLAVPAAGLGAMAMACCAGCSDKDLLPVTQPSITSGRDTLVVIMDDERQTHSLSLLMAGDVLVHDPIYESGFRSDGTRNYDHLFSHCADTLKAADIAVINQETILGGEALGFSGFPMFNSPQEIGDAEVAAGVDVVLGATNHAMDMGFEGIESELSFWRDKHPEVLVAGIADSEQMAQAIPLVTRNNITVALLNYTEGTNGIPLPVGKPYCVNMLHRADFATDVRRAREAGADVVVACPHWGNEYVYTASGSQRNIAADLITAGVDAIIGTHPHVLQPLEVLEGRDGKRVPVFWSIGNFLSRMPEAPRTIGGFAGLAMEKQGSACVITSCSLEPIVMHKTPQDNLGNSVYRLADYTDELASKSFVWTSDDFPAFNVEGCHEFVSMVLGPDYNRAVAKLTYEVNALQA